MPSYSRRSAIALAWAVAVILPASVGAEWFAAGWSAALTQAFEGSTPREHFIDLLTSGQGGVTLPPVPMEYRLTLQVPVIVASHSPQPKVPLVLLPPRMDRTTYQWGDPFVYEWIIANQGDRPISFPTLTADDRISRDMPGATVAVIGLRFSDERLNGEPVGLHALFGAESVARSMIVLSPKERLRVRAAGRWSLGNDARRVDAAVQTYLVKASIRISSAQRMDLVSQSDGDVAVSIRK